MVARIEPIIKGGMFMIKYDDEFRKHSYTKGFTIIHAMTIIIHAMMSIWKCSDKYEYNTRKNNKKFGR